MLRAPAVLYGPRSVSRLAWTALGGRRHVLRHHPTMPRDSGRLGRHHVLPSGTADAFAHGPPPTHLPVAIAVQVDRAIVVVSRPSSRRALRGVAGRREHGRGGVDRAQHQQVTSNECFCHAWRHISRALAVFELHGIRYDGLLYTPCCDNMHVCASVWVISEVLSERSMQPILINNNDRHLTICTVL